MMDTEADILRLDSMIAEEELLGAITREGRIDLAIGHVSLSDFACLTNARMFRLLLKMHEAGEKADGLALIRKVKPMENPWPYGGMPLVERVVLDAIGKPADVAVRARTVREFRAKRASLALRLVGDGGGVWREALAADAAGVQ